MVWFIYLFIICCKYGKGFNRKFVDLDNIMDKKLVEWRWDRETSKFLLEGLVEKVRKASSMSDSEYVLDVGGNTGGLSRLATDKQSVCIDIEPNRRFDDVLYIKGDVRSMPFENETFGMILAKAVLHHVPEEVEMAIEEIHRTARKGAYLVIEEPLASNPFSNVAGKFFTTDIHDEDEHPLEPELLIEAVKKYFGHIEIEYFFLTTYLMPHIISRFPGFMKGAFRNLTRLMQRFDDCMIRRCPWLARRCSYISIIAKK